MVTYEETYQELLSSTIDQNHRDLALSITDEIKEKLTSWGERHGMPYLLVKYNFHTDEAFRMIFIKDPKKQNLATMAFMRFIASCLGENKVKQLPNGGKDALYCLGGKVLQYSDIKNVRKTAKTIDFTLKDNHGRDIYISHKRTSGDSGGAQDNQKNDAESFLEEVRNNTDKSQIFIAVLDGDYYQHKNRLMEIKNSFYRENKIYVCNSDELVNIVIPTLNEVK